VIELRKLAVTELKKGILSIKLKDQSFNNNHAEYRTYLQEFSDGQHFIDKDMLLAKALAQAMHRCFIFIDPLKENSASAIYKFNAKSTKPIFGV
jgi:hypothetical protein